MKKGLFLLLLLIPAALGAQSIGKVHYGSKVFSTGLPEYLDGYWDPEVREPVCMPKERLETALECIEWTFGKIASYKEGYENANHSMCSPSRWTAAIKSGSRMVA